MNCPNCGAGTDQETLGAKLGLEVHVDLCFPCRVLWFDKLESLQLSAGGTLTLFRVLNDHHDDPRHALRQRILCPRCGSPLKLLHDIGKAGRFSYYRCPKEHGRLTPFSEFLKEKQFVRALSPLELERLKAEVKQVQCSSCGAPVDLTEGFQCAHCGAPLTVLDPDAVSRTLAELDAAETAHKSVPPESVEARARALAAMESLRRERPDPHELPFLFRSRETKSLGADLLSTSIRVLFKTLG